MKKYYVLTFVLLLSLHSYAQNLKSVIGKTLDENQTALPFVTVLVLQPIDSSIVKAAVSDIDGVFKVEGLVVGNYLLKATFVGYENFFRAFSLENTDLNLGELALNPVSTSLNELTVTATKPLFKVEVDRIVVNVENSVLAAGRNTLEVLALSPGLQVSPDESDIRFKGKGGVLVLIDGRQTYMSQSDAMRFLKGLSATEIESIELISNPPAKYDAAGVGGIINIKTIKNRSRGIKGNLQAGYRRGDYNHWNTGASLSVKSKALSNNVFASYSDGSTANFLESKTQYFDGGERGLAFDMSTNTKTHAKNFMIRNSLNWDISKNWEAGANFVFSRANDNERKRGETGVANNPSTISLINQTSKQLSKSNTFTANGYFKTILSGSNHELTGDLDYSSFKRDIVANIQNDLFQHSSENTTIPNGNQYFINTTPNTTDIVVGRLDYTKPVKNGMFEAGVKFSNVQGKNDAKFEEKEGNQWITDPGRTFNFNYSENITAAYTSYAFEHKKNSVKAGLRYEHTFAEGVSRNENARFTKNYGQLFPSLFYSRQLNDKNQIGMSYSRRITRPNYANLNPFVYVVDPYTVYTGNTDLNPATSNNWELNYTFNNTIQASLGYSKTKNNIHEVPLRSAENPDVLVYKNINVDNFDMYTAGIFWPINVTKNWQITQYGSLYYAKFRTKLENVELGTNAPTFYYNLSNNVSLPKGFKLEANWNYNGSTAWGLYKIEDYHNLNLGLRKSFNKDNTTLTFNFSDVFFSNKMTVKTDIPQFSQVGRVWQDSRRVGISLIHRFGKKTVQNTNIRQLSSDEERGRL